MRTPSTTASDFDSCGGATAWARSSASSPPEDRSTPTASALTLLLAAIAATLGLLVAAPGAFAAKAYLPAGQFPPPYPESQNWTPSSFNSIFAESVAVNDKNGHIYVADSGRGAIFDFNSASDNEPARWNGTNTPAGSFGGDGHVSVAADNTTGDVYVADRTHAVIDKFDQDGNLIASFGDTTPTSNGQLAGVATPAGSFSPPTSYYSSFPIAVDQSTHDLYVVDPGHKVIDVFDENGIYLRQITATPTDLYRFGGDYTLGIAVNATTHNVYVTDWAGPNLLFQFDSLGNYVSTWNGGALPNGFASQTPDGDFSGSCTGCSLISVATEDASGKVFVGAMAHGAVDIFDTGGNFLLPQLNAAEAGGNLLGYVAGVAIDQATGYLYVSSNSVQIFKPVIVPDVTIDPASNLAATAATLSGHVSPAGGGDITGCHFEYISDFNFLENTQAEQWKGAAQAPCETNPPSSLPYSAPTDVTAPATGLTPGFEYHFRIVVSNANGGVRASGPAFATVGSYGFASDFGSTGSGDGQLAEPKDVAVDNSTGDIYVADKGNHRIVKLDSSGDFVAAWGWGVSDGNAVSEVCTGGCQAGISGSGAGQFESPRYLEVDNSGGPSGGDVYVADVADGLVQKFDPSGSLIAGWGSGGAVDFSKGGAIAGIAVDTVGDLFVVNDAPPYNWTEVGQDGVFRSKTATGDYFGLGAPGGGGIEVDSFGGFYETQPGSSNGGVLYRNPTAEIYSGHAVYPGAYRGLINSGLAVDRSTSDVYVDQGSHIDRFSTAAGCVYASSYGDVRCAPQDTIGVGNLTSASGLAFNPSTRLLYAANTGGDEVVVFSPSPVPDVVTGAVTDPGPTSGTLTGHVDPAAAGEVTDCHFEFGTTAAYKLGSVPCSPAAPFSGVADVTADLSGLQPLVTYHYRLVARSTNELPSYGRDRSFTPAAGGGPGISAVSASNETPTTATVSAQVNPNFAPTTYRFQYGVDTTYGSQTLSGEPIGDDGVDHPISAQLSGLTPGTAYHFRVVAVNFNDVTAGPDQTFNTPGPPALGDSAASAITRTAAILSAHVQPGFRPTTYHFEYGTTSAYGSSTAQSALVGSDNSDHLASSAIAGLAPATSYHYRVVATNAIGTTSGSDSTFSTAPEEAAKSPPLTVCRRGFVKRHGKCVKRHKRRHHERSRHHG